MGRRPKVCVGPEAPAAPENFGLDALQVRIASLLELRRQRRLRVQLPLALLAGASLSVSVAMVVQPRAFGTAVAQTGELPLHVGAFALWLCVLTVDRLAVVLMTVVFAAAVAVSVHAESFAATVVPAASRLRAAAAAPGAGDDMAASLRAAGEVIGFISLVVSCALRACAVVSVLLRTSVGCWRRAGAPALSLRHLTSHFGWVSVALVVRALGQLLGLGLRGVLTLGPAAFHALFAVEATLVAFALFRPGVKAALHRWCFARSGDGVSSAAGIAEILDGVKASEVRDKAALSFRAVPMDRFRFEHMTRAAGAATDAVGLRELADRNGRGGRLRLAAALRAAQSGLQASRTLGRRGSLTSSFHNASKPELSPGVANGVQTASAEGGARPMQASPLRLALGPSEPAAIAAAESGHARVCQPAKLREVDAFISHSWHDDPVAKWGALQLWRSAFVAANGREPLVWFDALCIDQDDIATQLPLLPIYLAGCNSLLVLYGSTYLSRLWCVAELFVFYQTHLPDPPERKIHFVPLREPAGAAAAGVDSSRVDAPPPLDAAALVGSSAAATGGAGSPLSGGLTVPQRVGRGPRALSQMWVAGTVDPAADEPSHSSSRANAHITGAIAAAQHFDVLAATTAVPADKARLLAVIEGSGDSIIAFNKWTRETVSKKLSEVRDEEATRTRLAHQLEREVREHARRTRSVRQLSLGNVPLGARFARRPLDAEPSGEGGCTTVAESAPGSAARLRPRAQQATVNFDLDAFTQPALRDVPASGAGKDHAGAAAPPSLVELDAAPLDRKQVGGRAATDPKLIGCTPSSRSHATTAWTGLAGVSADGGISERQSIGQEG